MKFLKEFLINLGALLAALVLLFFPEIIAAIACSFFGVSENAGWWIVLIGLILQIAGGITLVHFLFPEGMVISESKTVITEIKGGR